MSETKPWGICTPIAVTENMQFDKLLIFPGGFSSLHFHHRKTNLFFVESGLLELYVQRDDEQFGKFVMEPGSAISTNPQSVHQFHAPNGATIYEVYWQTPGEKAIDREDIVRLTDNGKGGFVEPTDAMVQRGLARLATPLDD